MKIRRVRFSALTVGAVAGLFCARTARAVDVGDVSGQSVQLDVTETTIAAQHFDKRDNERLQDSGWGGWVNRLDAALRWGKWTAGLRLDSAVYWRRPFDSPAYAKLVLEDPVRRDVATDNESRYKNSIYPAKLWATYAGPGIEVTVGDAYVQFGRGLTLSMRKIDELGIDTTVRGAKVEVQKDPFALTVVAGFANPSRVDEATGRAIFPTTGAPSEPVFGSDRLVGIELQAGRGLPVTLATRAVRYSRCAPYHYDPDGTIDTNVFRDPGGVMFGSCDATDTATWLSPSTFPPAPPVLRARDITMAGQSIEVPTLGGHGALYLEGAVQQRQYTDNPKNNSSGNALYGSFSADAGPITTTLEIKSNRNFYPVAAGINLNAAPEFNVVAYSFSPPAETPTILDTEFGYFNACVDGGRFRANVNANDHLLVYGQGIYAYTKTEDVTGLCDAQGHTVGPGTADRVWDGLSGLEWSFDDSLSHVFVSSGLREDTKSSGEWFYHERHLEYSIVKYLGNAYSLEVQGFHRLRQEQSQNFESYIPRWWHEGENYVALKIAPTWVFTQGFEYTTRSGEPTYYVNGSMLYKFTSSSNLRVFVGQQRGAFRCASGVCRYFTPFEGARAELTVRF